MVILHFQDLLNVLSCTTSYLEDAGIGRFQVQKLDCSITLVLEALLLLDCTNEDLLNQGTLPLYWYLRLLLWLLL